MGFPWQNVVFISNKTFEVSCGFESIPDIRAVYSIFLIKQLPKTVATFPWRGSGWATPQRGDKGTQVLFDF